MALGGGDLTVVSLVPVVVTVDVVFCVIELSSTASTGNTKTIQKQATMPIAIALFIFLSIELLLIVYNFKIT
jgi:uncharacterized membrane protein